MASLDLEIGYVEQEQGITTVEGAGRFSLQVLRRLSNLTTRLEVLEALLAPTRGVGSGQRSPTHAAAADPPATATPDGAATNAAGATDEAGTEGQDDG